MVPVTVAFIACFILRVIFQMVEEKEEDPKISICKYCNRNHVKIGEQCMGCGARMDS